MPKKNLIGIIIVVLIAGGYLLLEIGREEEKRATLEEVEPRGEKIIALEKKKVLIVHSYHKEWGWNQDTEEGIIEGLKRKGYILNRDYEFKEFYMDTKNTYTTPEQIRMRAEEAMEIINEFDPDIVLVNDDNALKYVAVVYAMENPDKKLSFVFSGINVDPSIYDPIESLEKPGDGISGVLERFPYYQSFSLGKRIFPNATKVILLADSSPSSNFLVNAFRERYLEKVGDSPLEVIGVVQVKTFDEWKDAVEEYQDKADFLGTLTYHQLRDENGEVVPASEVVLWTINHNKLPELGFLLFHAEDGFWATVGVSAYKAGIYVGTISGEILDGRDPGTISIVDPQLVDIAFNLERSKMLGIEIPVSELNRATKVFQEIKRPRY